ncbi:hypothetical protein [Mesorhizobium sp.]|uniref:hypothetical protein n=1 Tax=Mesorhizobium sp. TaxID=1871066 RepID=UPI000FE53E48|nr:hypothetical protein [Mesorhizobium sp.]RWI35397.1 MAG: hypothetical protein EOR14_28245 [Mesorhizobium sp.]RWJ66434.1 MAG: hypothetical protein EOR34_28890 [Mesorhizobium sp.]
MTTIAYRDGILAVDSRSTRGNTIVPGACAKLVRMKDGSVATGCGTKGNIAAFIRWLDDGKEGKPPKLDKSTIVHLQADGRVFEYWDENPVETTGPFEAWGSGADFALGCLWAGLSAEEAVRAACKCDSGSGEPVFTMRVEVPSPAPCKPKKKRK